MHPKTGQAVQLPKTESCGPALSPWSSPGLGGCPTASPSRNICCAFTCWESNCYSLLLCSPHLLCFYLVRIKLLFFVAVQSSFVVLLPGENQTVILCCCAIIICCAFTWWESNCYSLLLCSPHLLCFYLVRIKLLFFVAVPSLFVVLLPGENQTVILCCCAVLICCAFTWWESNCYSLLLCSPHLLCFYLVRIKLLFFVAVPSLFVVLLPGENQTVILCCCAVLICCAFTWWESNCYSLLLCHHYLLCFYLVRIKWLVVSLLLCSTHKWWELNCCSVFVAVQYSQTVRINLIFCLCWCAVLTAWLPQHWEGPWSLSCRRFSLHTSAPATSGSRYAWKQKPKENSINMVTMSKPRALPVWTSV